EPPGGLQVALDAGQVEESQERHAVERRARPGPSLQVADDQFVDQTLIERQIGVPQQGREVVGGGAHESVLEVEDAQAPVLHHEIAAVVVPMGEDTGLRRHHLGDLPHLSPDDVTIFVRQRLPARFSMPYSMKWSNSHIRSGTSKARSNARQAGSAGNVAFRWRRTSRSTAWR